MVLRVLRCPLQRWDPADLYLRNTEYPRVRGDHDDHGDVETYQWRRDGIRPVQVGFAVVAVVGAVARCALPIVLSHVPVELDRDKRDEDGQGPRHSDHHESHPVGHLALVPERARYGPVAVHADDAQVEDGRGGAHDVKGDPDAAKPAEEPSARHRGYCLPRHHQDGYEEIRNGQRNNEKVGHFGAQVSKFDHGGAHERVPKQCGDDEEEEHKTQQSAHAVLSVSILSLLRSVRAVLRVVCAVFHL